MPNLNLDRQILAQFLPNHQAIVAFENIQDSVFTGLPSTIEEAAAQAALATAFAQQALSMLGDVLAGLEQLQAAPPAIPVIEKDELTPRPELGTISSQNADFVDITGGRIGLDAGTVGAPSLYFGGDVTSGVYRNGADVLDVSIAGVKLLELSTALAAVTGDVNVTKTITANSIADQYALKHLDGVPFGGKFYAGTFVGHSVSTNQGGGYGYVYDPGVPTDSFFHQTPFGSAEGSIFKLTALGNMTNAGGFGTNGAAAQAPYSSGGTVVTTGATNITPFGYTTAAQADDIITKLNNVISALVANGIMS